MAHLFPFRAVLPPADRAKQIASPPYDVVSSDEAAEIVAGNPLSFMRVARAESELQPGVDPRDEQVYRRAMVVYREIRDQAPLRQDAEPSFYVYALEMDDHRQVGIVGAPALDDYDLGNIKKHEKTMPDKEDDRTRHILALSSQTGPVFLTYPDQPEIDTIVADTVTQTPLFDFKAHADIRHTGWRLPQAMAAPLGNAFRKVPALYIADGHHRAAAASRARTALRKANPAHTGNEEYNRFLAVVFPASQLQVFAYNRTVKDLNGLELNDLIGRVRADFEVTPTNTAEPESPGRIHLYAERQWRCLRHIGRTDHLSPAKRLDVSLLQELVLAPHLGIADPRTSSRVEFVGGIRGTEELEKRVDRGDAAAAFSMYPTTVNQLIAVTHAGETMPPKSTWFEPKLRDGLFVHEI